MAYKKRVRENYDIKAAGAGSFSKDNKYIGRAVTIIDNRVAELAGPDAQVDGSIEAFDGGQVVVIVESEEVPFKNAGTTAITVGARIVGATRVIETGKTAERGYVKAFTSDVDAAGNTETQIEAAIDAAVNAAVKARGTVRNGGAANTANGDVPADVKVAMSCG